MSVRVMAWVWEHSQAKPMQRLVLLAIADCANDAGSDAYPSTATLARKTGMSERGVRKTVAELTELGELRVEYKAGPRGCNRYHVRMDRHPEQRAGSGSDAAPDAGYTEQDAGSNTRHGKPRTRHAVPRTRHETTVNPAPRAPEPSENHPEPSVDPSGADKPRDRRATRLPDDFTATPEMITWAREHTPNVGTRETEAFIDYWRAKAGAGATKLDWPATWRNWMRRAQDDLGNRRNGHARASPDRPSTTDARIAQAQAAGDRVQARLDQQAKEITDGRS